MIEEIREALNLPVKYDDYGQIILDSKGNLLVNIRGWGMFQKLPNGQEIQDGFGKMVVDFINNDYKAGQESLKAENEGLRLRVRDMQANTSLDDEYIKRLKSEKNRLKHALSIISKYKLSCEEMFQDINKIDVHGRYDWMIQTSREALKEIKE